MSAKIAKDVRTGESRGYGFVWFKNACDATQAMLDYKGGNDKFKLEWYRARIERSKVAPRFQKLESEKADKTILLSWHPDADLGEHVGEQLSQGDFHRFFTRIGAVDEVQYERRKCSAKVIFMLKSDADVAASLDRIEIRGRRMFAILLQERQTKEVKVVPKQTVQLQGGAIKNDCNLVIKNLCPSVTHDKLRLIFQKFGEIQSMKLKIQCN